MRWLPAVVLVPLLALAACGSGSTSPSSVATEATGTPQLRGVSMASVNEVIVGDWWSRYLGGQAEEAYAQLSTRCQQLTPKAEFVAAADAAANEYGEQTLSSFSQRVDGKITLVTYTFAAAPDLNRTDQRWIDDPSTTLHIGRDITTLRNDDC